MKKFIFLVMIISILYGYSYVNENASKGSSSAADATTIQTSPQTSLAQNTSTNKPIIKILFIGNSYTFYNDLPKMLESLASSDPDNKTQFVTESITQGGAHLIDLWNAGNAANKIKSTHWDYVVLQDQSVWALSPYDINTAHEAGAKFANLINQSGGKIILYQTWPRQPGSTWYSDPKTSSLIKNPDYMQSYLHYYNNALATAINASVVPVGDVWSYAIKNNKELNLYQSDGSHPSIEGTYLAALLFYMYISGNNGEQVSFVPQGGNISAITYIKNMLVHPK